MLSYKRAQRGVLEQQQPRRVVRAGSTAAAEWGVCAGTDADGRPAVLWRHELHDQDTARQEVCTAIPHRGCIGGPLHRVPHGGAQPAGHLAPQPADIRTAVQAGNSS